MSKITLRSLIQEHKEQFFSLRLWGGNYCYSNQQQYENWLAKARRYLSTHFADDKQALEFDSISREIMSKNQQDRMLAILEALTLLPKTVHVNQTNIQNKPKQDSMSITINNTNSQSQNQKQSLAVQLFIEAIKDDLTGRQIKELKAVVAEADNDLQKVRPGILAKLAEFGKDVASNIVANILTNPMIWGGL